ncbi:MAG TPA: heat-inducible transcriptional repressor HrcA [Ktedonobacterales bacterium]|nr:heat-inducible transcriptional repressor HrcA [Ktedonobacterales bacterium]
MAGRERLSLRKEVILRALVEHYVRTGEPVPSRLISDQLASVYGPGYGPATVRNELVALEEDGLILQPHISAGRIPTDLGYRYFVERLMGESRLAPEEQRLIRHQFYQVQHRLDEWVRLTASILAQVLQAAAVITPPRDADARLKHFELLALYESVALIVLVLEDGTVRQERIILENPASQEELSRLASRLNERFRGADAHTIDTLAFGSGGLPPDEALVMASLARMLAQLDILTPDAFYHEGIAQLLQRDDFAGSEGDHVRKVVEALEQNRLIPALAPQVMQGEGVQVIIGGENDADALKDMSVVIARYGERGGMGGLLGIVGPTRMQYGRAVAVVRYLTQLLNDLLAETYNPQDVSDTPGPDDADNTSDSNGMDDPATSHSESFRSEGS